MKEFIYYTPTKVFFGKGYERKVGEILKSYKIKKFYFIMDKNRLKKRDFMILLKSH